MLELFLPKRCIHCKEPAERSAQILSKYLCANCLRTYHFLEPPGVDEIDDRRQLLSHLPYPIGIYAAHTFVHDGLIQSIVHHFKYNDMPRLARHIGNDIALTFKELENFSDIILPVPLHVTRYAERGFNQSEILARSLSHAFGKRLDTKSLRRIKPTPSQTGLTLLEREENVRDAFKLTKSRVPFLEGKRLLIVDDVITTGATMASIGAELIHAKPKQVGFFALAAAQLGI